MSAHKAEETIASLTSGKLPRNLSWQDVLDAINHIGQVQPHGEDFAFVVGSQRGIFKKPHGHSLDTEEVSELRRFLHAAQATPVEPVATSLGRIVVVLDHGGAELFADEGENHFKPEQHITPYDPKGFQRHLIHRKESHYQGERVPEESSFYEAIAAALSPAKEIVLMGPGTGTSSAMSYLQHFLQEHHATIAARVVMTRDIDLSALSRPQIEAMAKEQLRA